MIIDDAIFLERAYVDDTRNLKLRSERSFLQHVRRLRANEYYVAVFPFVAARSARANRFYWAVVVGTVAEYMGEDDHQAVHELLKLQCNPKVIINKETGEEHTVGGSTRMGSPEFWRYIERCQRWAVEHCNGLYIPDPHEDLKPQEAA